MEAITERRQFITGATYRGKQALAPTDNLESTVHRSWMSIGVWEGAGAPAEYLHRHRSFEVDGRTVGWMTVGG